MSYEVRTIAEFDRSFKRLAKKHSSLKNDLLLLIERLSKEPSIGTDLGGGLRKVRIQIKSKGRGKSGGGRVITLLKRIDGKQQTGSIYLLGIYDKSAIDSIPKEFFQALASSIAD